LGSGGALCCGAALWIRGAVAAVAECLRVDARGWLILEFDHHVYFAAIRKCVFLERSDGSVACVLRAIETGALSVRHFGGSTDEIREQTEG